jgi:hypothetical protein
VDKEEAEEGPEEEAECPEPLLPWRSGGRGSLYSRHFREAVARVGGPGLVEE